MISNARLELRLVILTAAIGMLLSPSALAGDRPRFVVEAGDTRNVCRADGVVHERLALLVGFAVVANNRTAFDSALTCVIDLWPDVAESGAGGELSNAMLALMSRNPRAFFARIRSEPQIVDDWVHSLQRRSFSWNQGGECELEEYRQQLVNRLGEMKPLEGDTDALRLLVLEKLTMVRCRMVE